MVPSFTALAVEAFARGLVSGGATRADLAAVASAIARTCIAQDLCAIGSEHLLKPPAGPGLEALTPEAPPRCLARSKPTVARAKPFVVQAELPVPPACTTAPGLSDVHGPHGAVSCSPEVPQEHHGAPSDLVAKLEAFYVHFNKELISRAGEKVAFCDGNADIINTKLRARYGADLTFMDSFGIKQDTGAPDTGAAAKTALVLSSPSSAQRPDMRGGSEQAIGATSSWPATSSWQADDKWRLQQPRRRPRRQLQS